MGIMVDRGRCWAPRCLAIYVATSGVVNLEDGVVKACKSINVVLLYAIFKDFCKKKICQSLNFDKVCVINSINSNSIPIGASNQLLAISAKRWRWEDSGPVEYYHRVSHWQLYFFKGTLLLKRLPYRIDIYELLNRTSSRIVRVESASELAQEFWIELPPKVKIKNSTSSVFSSLYGML